MKIAFIKSGTFSHINESVRKQLEKNFPGSELVVFDIRELVRRPYGFVLRNLASMVSAYGVRELIRRRDPTDCFIQSPACFAFIREEMRHRVQGRGFAFTFQTQSMWDASVPGVPHFVYTDHTELTPLQQAGFDRSKLHGEWWLRLEREIYQRAARVFTMSSNVRRSVIEDYGCAADKVRCVFAGSNVEVSRGEAVNLERYQRKSILFVGVDWERKGGPELLRAFEKVAVKHPEATLTIVGCSPPVQMRNCQVLGRLPLERVAELYESASVFCLPTRHEPFGVAFLEAMHHGLPVIGTNLGAIPDFICEGDNGHLVPRGDSDALAVALDRLLANPEEMQRMGRQSRARARMHYTWDQVGLRLREEISGVIDHAEVKR